MPLPSGVPVSPATPVWAIFTMQDYLLTALKRATVVPVENLAFALLKMGLLGAAVGLSYVFGIAVSWVVATVLIVAAVNAWLLLRAVPQQATGEPAEPVRPRAVARFVLDGLIQRRHALRSPLRR